MTPMVSTSSVFKSYRNKDVLRGVDLVVEPGEVCALMGKNGAGKSTLIRILLGLAFPDSGAIEVAGAPPGRSHGRVGYLSENLAIYPHLSAADNLRVASLAAGSPSPTPRQIEEALERVALADVGRKRARSFSLGMKRRLQLAMATLPPRADLLILDEPTNGLDVNGLLLFKEFLASARTEGTTVLMASHALAELQDSITHYAILAGGVVKDRGEWGAPRTGIRQYRVRLAQEDTERAREALAGTGDAEVLAGGESGLLVVRTRLDIRDVHRFLYGAAIIPGSVEEDVATLEDLFRSVENGVMA